MGESVQGWLGSVMHGLCWTLPLARAAAVGHLLHTELAQVFTSTARSKEEALGLFFSLSS